MVVTPASPAPTNSPAVPSRRRRRVADYVVTSICVVLLAEACDTGFEPLIGRDTPALRRSRLS